MVVMRIWGPLPSKWCLDMDCTFSNWNEFPWSIKLQHTYTNTLMFRCWSIWLRWFRWYKYYAFFLSFFPFLVGPKFSIEVDYSHATTQVPMLAFQSRWSIKTLSRSNCDTFDLFPLWVYFGEGTYMIEILDSNSF